MSLLSRNVPSLYLYLTESGSIHVKCQVTSLPDFHMGEFCVPLAVNFIHAYYSKKMCNNTDIQMKHCRSWDLKCYM